jgi:hypothetical protein
VGFASPEPLLNLTVGALALFDVERVASATAALTPIALLVFGLGIYRGLARRDGAADEQDAWERVMLVFAALSLSSLSMNPRPPTPAFWAGNFLLKPNHGAALGLVAVAAGLLVAKKPRPLLLGLVLGLLAWVFLLDWAYALPGLLIAAFLFPKAERPLRPLALAALVSALIALPYVLHLLPDYSPAKSHGAAQHMWGDPRGLPLAVPNWSTLDLGPLLVLGVLGALAMWRRRSARDSALLGLLFGAAALVLLSIPAALVGIAPEPDELHYYLRFCISLAAGAALAAGARFVEGARALQPGQGHVLALALFVPLSFPVYWDPPSMDRYFALSRQQLRPKVVAYARFIRDGTPRDAVFVAGRDGGQLDPRAHRPPRGAGRGRPADAGGQGRTQERGAHAAALGRSRQDPRRRAALRRHAPRDRRRARPGVRRRRLRGSGQGAVVQDRLSQLGGPHRRARAPVTRATRGLALFAVLNFVLVNALMLAARVPARDTGPAPARRGS